MQKRGAVRDSNSGTYRQRASLGVIVLTVFLDLLAFGMVIPLMPLYADAFHASGLAIGWLLAIYSLMQFLFAPIWGRLSDRIGRKPVLLIGLWGSAAAHLIYGLAGGVTVLLLARALAGVAGANISVAHAYVADITKPEDRAKGMGLLGAALGMGFVVGPALGGVLSQFGLQTTPLVAAALAGINAIMAMVILKESRVPTAVPYKPYVHPLAVATWQHAVKGVGVALLVLVALLSMTAFSAFETVLPLFGKAHLGWSMTTVGWFFAYVGILIVLVQGGLIRRLIPRLGESRTASVGLVLTALGLLWMASLPGVVGLYLVMIPLALGVGMTNPSLSALVSLNSAQAEQGVALGFYQSASSLGRVLGPLLGGGVYQYAHGAGGALMAAAGIMLLAVLLFLGMAVPRLSVRRALRQSAAH